MDDKAESDAVWGCLFVALGLAFVAFLVFIFTVVVPDGRSQIDRCEAKGGIMIKGGTCVKKDSLVGY